MIDATLSILFSTAILVFFRLLKPNADATLQVITLNYFVATFLGLLSTHHYINEAATHWPAWGAWAILLGLLFMGTFFLFAMSSQKAGVALTAVASRMSVIIPVLGGLLIFDEKAGLVRWIGLALIFPAFYYTLYNGEKRGKSILTFDTMLPFALLLGTGLNDLLMNYATRVYAPVDLAFMLSIIFGVAFLIGGSILLVKTLRGEASFRPSLIPSGILLGLINYASTFFLMRSMSQLSATVLFPLVNASIVVLAVIIDIMLFGHRPTPRQWSGLVLAVVAIVLITRG